jgi:hypothetical protein
LERPPAYKPQAKAHRADKPQPLPAVESHVESRTFEDRISIRTCSNRSTQSGTAPEQQLPDAAPICTTGWWGMTGVQTGWDSRLCAGAALVIGCQTFGFGGHAATETGTIVPVCGRWQNAAVLTKFRTSQCGRGGSPCGRSSSSSVQKSRPNTRLCA